MIGPGRCVCIFFSAALIAGACARQAAPRAVERADVAIKASRVLDPVSGTYAGPSVVLVTGSRIADVVPAAKFRGEMADSVLDLGDLTLLPGLIDSHVHLAIGGIRQSALANLNAGFTTVVDLGARSFAVLRARDSINAGLIRGPRVLAAGLWIGVKGGICEFGGIGVPGGPDQFRVRVRENVEAGANVVKLCVSGWPRAAFGNPEAFEMPESALAASIDEAHRSGKPVIGHDISLAGVRAAVRYGINGFAHAAYIDSATAAELARRKTFIIPTLASLTGGDTSRAAGALTDAVALSYRAGVPIVFGTDGGVLPHGRNSEEFIAMAAAGISSRDALRAATVNAARAWGLIDSVGIIDRGMVADMIAVRGDPLADLSALSRVAFVMARGIVVAKP